MDLNNNEYVFVSDLSKLERDIMQTLYKKINYSIKNKKQSFTSTPKILKNTLVFCLKELSQKLIAKHNKNKSKILQNIDDIIKYALWAQNSDRAKISNITSTKMFLEDIEFITSLIYELKYVFCQLEDVEKRIFRNINLKDESNTVLMKFMNNADISVNRDYKFSNLSETKYYNDYYKDLICDVVDLLRERAYSVGRKCSLVKLGIIYKAIIIPKKANDDLLIAMLDNNFVTLDKLQRDEYSILRDENCNIVWN